MSRRRFAGLAAVGVGALALPGCGAPRAPAGGPRRSTPLLPGTTAVAVAGVPRGGGAAQVAGAVRDATLAVTDLDWLGRGDSVLIKPVCNSGEVYPATTDPLALAAMVTLLRERGAGRVIVADMSGVQYLRFGPDGPRGSTRALLERNGIARAVLEAGGEIQAFEEAGWSGFVEEAPRESASWRGGLFVPKLLSEVDHVVLMPRCARHSLAGSTLGLKAAVGWWRHDSRLEYHRDAATFSAKTAQGNTLPSLLEKQRLVLTSATQVLSTFGPDKGFVVTPEVGLVVASASVVAHDMVSLAWLLECRRTMPAADREGMIDDPNSSQLLVDLGNRVVVGWLGGWGTALGADRLERYELETVWDDLVLAHAFDAFGGVPRVELVEANDAAGRLPRARLASAVTSSDQAAFAGGASPS